VGVGDDMSLACDERDASPRAGTRAPPRRSSRLAVSARHTCSGAQAAPGFARAGFFFAAAAPACATAASR
jgi:hypothetical protein